LQRIWTCTALEIGIVAIAFFVRLSFGFLLPEALDLSRKLPFVRWFVSQSCCWPGGSILNFDAGEWSISAEKSKMGKPHIVYLSSQITAMFRELKVLACGSAWVLEDRSGRSGLGRNTLNNAVARLPFTNLEPMTIHDLRRTASTLLHEKGFSGDVIEKALDHSMRGVRASLESQTANGCPVLRRAGTTSREALFAQRRILIGRIARSPERAQTSCAFLLTMTYMDARYSGVSSDPSFSARAPTLALA
jgi:Phage integrase family